MTTYRFTAERSHQWWAIISPDVTGAATQARRLDQAEPMAREVISLLLEVPEDDIDIDLEVILDDDGQAALAMATEARHAAEQAATAAQQAAQTAARTLHDQGMPLRDVGRIMGVSHQRVHQLLHA